MHFDTSHLCVNLTVFVTNNRLCIAIWNVRNVNSKELVGKISVSGTTKIEQKLKGMSDLMKYRFNS